MTPAMWGAVLGALAAAGAILAVRRAAVIRHPQLSVRVLPFVRDLPQVGRTPRLRPVAAEPTSAAVGIFGPILRAAADGVERLLGGAHSVRRRLARAGLEKSVHEFRVEQVLWGVGGFALTAAWGLVRALAGGGSPVAALVLCGAGFAAGVLLCDQHLSTRATRRERAILQEFPTVAELLALAVAAGESPVAALTRVVDRSRGELSVDLGRVLAAIRTGEPIGSAFDALAAATGLPVVARFAQAIAVAVERGTPLAEVLHAQAADVREAGRRDLIETAARKEVFMMAPVVFVVLPVTVFFAFWPGYLGLSLTTP